MTSALRTTALLITLSAASLPVHAAAPCVTSAVQVDNSYQYISNLTESLIYARSALERTTLSRRSGNIDTFEYLLGLKLAKGDYECAQALVAPFAAGRSEAIKGSASGASAVFARLADLNDRSVKVYSDFLDAGGAKPGTFLEQQAELGAAYDETWKLLITVVIAGTYAVVEEDPSTGLMSGLALTAAQQKVIVQKLTTTFGNGVTHGIQAGQAPLLAAASALYEVISDPKRRVRSQR